MGVSLPSTAIAADRVAKVTIRARRKFKASDHRSSSVDRKAPA